MWWIVAILVIIGMLLGEEAGCAVLSLGLIALAFLLLKWIFDWAFLLTLAKICAGLLIVIFVLAILGNFFN